LRLFVVEETRGNLATAFLFTYLGDPDRRGGVLVVSAKWSQCVDDLGAVWGDVQVARDLEVR
jgi:hypothetical protein